MSGPMYFNPTADQVAVSKASTCRMATPKDPTDCENKRVCMNKPTGSGACPTCHNYRPRLEQLAITEAAAIEQDRSIARAKDSGAYGREEVARAHRLDLQYGVGQ